MVSNIYILAESYLLAPIPMSLGERDGHVSQVGHFLPLKSVKVALDRRRGVLEILGRQVKGVFELQRRQG